ncbi:type II toxin-antitoxin system VapC family toxin [Mycobacterium sp.]|uniref:type II toxin-antitoxin system VapC family toxin n=1 Tax=Mycobacterium sp. TaxID=1785 RepID=UPI00127063D3|nr:type II toxin-antitoxin system VapC family toxin [Mycobacterium sp.]KAA8960980.1 MAG: type II toxin-antitoxin system VapC family toxin [Mycobacterium sp.]
MIVDASVVIDAVTDSGPRGHDARRALAEHPASEPLLAPGHLPVEVLLGLVAAANRPSHPLQQAEIEQALHDAAALEITIEATPWTDVHRAWVLARASLRYADAIYVAAAERHSAALLTSDARIQRSGAPIRCRVVTL